jgi:hypothetical protein
VSVGSVSGKPYFFISYSHANEKIVHRIHDALSAKGYVLWIDIQNLGVSHDGRGWDENAKEDLISEDCLGIVFMRSRYSITSEQTLKELKAVREWNRVWPHANKAIISVHLEKATWRLSEYKNLLETLQDRSFMLSASGADKLKILHQQIQDYFEDPSRVHESTRELFDFITDHQENFRHETRLKDLSLSRLQAHDLAGYFRRLVKELEISRKLIDKHEELIAENAISILYDERSFDETIDRLAAELDKALAQRGAPSPRGGRRVPQEAAAGGGLTAEAEPPQADRRSQANPLRAERSGEWKSAADLYRAIIELLVDRHPERLDALIEAGANVFAEHTDKVLQVKEHRCAANGRKYFLSAHCSTEEKGKRLKNKILPVFGLAVPAALEPLDSAAKLESLLVRLQEAFGGSAEASAAAEGAMAAAAESGAERAAAIAAPEQEAASEETGRSEAGTDAHAAEGGQRESPARSGMSDAALYLDIVERLLNGHLEDGQTAEAFGIRSLQLYRDEQEARSSTKHRTSKIRVRGNEAIIGMNISTKEKVRRVALLVRHFGLEQLIDLNFPEGMTDREKLIAVRERLMENSGQA